MTLDAIPIIDIAPLIAGDGAARRAVGHQLREACVGAGFFYVSGHGIQPERMTGLFAEAARFFALPDADKTALDVAKSSDFRGYAGLLVENNDATANGDLKESFDMALKAPELNQWPVQLPDFRGMSETYLADMVSLSQTLMRGFALALGLDEHHFDAMVDRPMAMVRYLHYPSQEGEIDERQIGIGAHTDFEALTILAQDDVNALQVSDGTGGWIAATPIAGTFVVNIGDMMQRWTNDLFRSTLHRVINVSGRERQSIPFFFGPNEDTMIETLPGCFGADNPYRYPPVRALDYSRERLAQAYGKVFEAA